MVDLKETTEMESKENPNGIYRYTEYHYKKRKEHFLDIYGKCYSFMSDVFNMARSGGVPSYREVTAYTELLYREYTENLDSLIIFGRVNFDDYEYFASHSVNRAFLSLTLAENMEMPEEKKIKLGASAMLADIGLAKIPFKIISKKGRLTPQEYNIIKTHPIQTYKLLQKSGDYDIEVLSTVLEHHELSDGTGYPRGLHSDEISTYAKIIGIADSYAAMISKRVYKGKLTTSAAMKSMLQEVSTKYDQDLLRIFLSAMSIYPLGSYVLLNTGEVGLVVKPNKGRPLRPYVKVLFDRRGEKVQAPYVYNLLKHQQHFIVKPIENPAAHFSGAADEKQ